MGNTSGFLRYELWVMRYGAASYRSTTFRFLRNWIPAFAGMTTSVLLYVLECHPELVEGRSKDILKHV